MQSMMSYAESVSLWDRHNAAKRVSTPLSLLNPDGLSLYATRKLLQGADGRRA